MVDKFHEFRSSLTLNLIKQSIATMLNAVAEEADWIQNLVVFFIVDVEEDHGEGREEFLCNIWAHDLRHILQK